MDRDQSERLATWLHAEHIGQGAVSEIVPLAGGTQNVLLRFRIGEEYLVLRGPAVNARPETDRVIRREAKVLAALDGTAVRHARFRGLCTDPRVIGSTFLVTDAIAGFNAAVAMSDQARSDPATRRRMGDEMIDGIVALAGIDIVAQRLDDLGRLGDFIERQVPRWASQLESYATFAGWPGPDALGDVAALGRWLDANRPQDWRGGLMHGDYHIANVLFAEDGALAAILDWELAALGDPLLDLGRLLAAWPEPDGSGPLSLKVEPWEGFPAREALIERYAAGTGRSMANILWYEVLACYKLGIILEGTFARACASLAPRETGDRLHNGAIGLIERATRWLEARG